MRYKASSFHDGYPHKDITLLHCLNRIAIDPPIQIVVVAKSNLPSTIFSKNRDGVGKSIGCVTCPPYVCGGLQIKPPPLEMDITTY